MINNFDNNNSSYFDNLTQENRQDKYFDNYGNNKNDNNKNNNKLSLKIFFIALAIILIASFFIIGRKDILILTTLHGKPWRFFDNIIQMAFATSLSARAKMLFDSI